MSNNSYIDETGLGNYLNNNSYIDETGLGNYLSDNGYIDTSGLEDYLSNNNYVNDSNIETAISPYISDFLTSDVLTKYVLAISEKANFKQFEITDTDTSGSFTYTLDLSDINIYSTPIVQVTYNDQVLFSDITITFSSSRDSATITWDDTKYPVSSNDPLIVTVAGIIAQPNS